MRKRRAIYPGSFDPITNGHIDVAARALNMFDEVILAVANNSEKHPSFPVAERVRLATLATQHLQTEGQQIEVTSFAGLLVDFARERDACAIIRGLRAVSDFEFEFQLALMNRELNPEVETIFLMPKATCVYLSSRIVKEIARLGGNISTFVPECVAQALSRSHP